MKQTKRKETVVWYPEIVIILLSRFQVNFRITGKVFYELWMKLRRKYDTTFVFGACGQHCEFYFSELARNNSYEFKY